MKRTLRNLVLAGTIALSSLSPVKKALAEPVEPKDKKPISVSIDNNYASKYLFLGLSFSEGPVWQPTLNVSRGNLSSFLMANKDLTTKEFNEFDLGLNWNIPILRDTSLSLGTIYFPAKVEGEWKSIGTSYAALNSGPLSVKLGKLWGAVGGTYVGINYSKDYPVSKKITVSNSTSIVSNDGIFRDKKGLTHFETTLTGSLALTDKLDVNAQVVWINPLSDDMDGQLCFRTNVSYRLTKKPEVQK
ncbi:MAG TPA: hypothetical protein VMV95_01210 [Bacillota bacterium]|nr:hypothetical protein [Bacillota bacterium]